MLLQIAYASTGERIFGLSFPNLASPRLARIKRTWASQTQNERSRRTHGMVRHHDPDTDLQRVGDDRVDRHLPFAFVLEILRPSSPQTFRPRLRPAKETTATERNERERRRRRQTTTDPQTFRPTQGPQTKTAVMFAESVPSAESVILQAAWRNEVMQRLSAYAN